MLYNYLALLFFAVFAVFIPASFLMFAKLLGKRSEGNPVKNAPYESGEETVGRSRDIDNEYLPFFMIFIPFEIIVAILILWAMVARDLTYSYGIAFAMLGVLATVLSLVGYRMIVVKWTK